MIPFSIGLLLASAGTMIYEVVLTRLLSVISWYYLAFVSVSMAMFGMTVGAIAVQLAPGFFAERLIPRRLTQAVIAAAIAMPATLVVMLAVPIEVSYAVETIFSFILFSAIIAVPFFFSGIAICLSLTRSPFPIGRVYFVDLLGAAAGCLGAIGLLMVVDAPSAMLATSALFFVSAAAYAGYSRELDRRRGLLGCALLMVVLTVMNSATLYGIQPIWSKGKLDPRDNLLAELWNPISRVRARQVVHGAMPSLWGPSVKTPATRIDTISLDIDNEAGTPLFKFTGDLAPFDFLRYDVTSLAVQLRKDGSAAIIGFGGGRDALAAAANGFHRIVGIELNSSMLDLTMHRLRWFSDFSKVRGLEVHQEEGRSYLTRSAEKFDVIQASMVDTWAATSAGAMTLSENSLYTVEGWRIFYHHLKPGGLLTFSRWAIGSEGIQTIRMFSLAWATLLSEGVSDPGSHLALITSGRVATLLMSNRPLSADDLQQLGNISKDMGFQILFIPSLPTQDPGLRKIAASSTLTDLARVGRESQLDYSPVYDSSPFFFNTLRLRRLPLLFRTIAVQGMTGNLRATAFMLLFMLASLVLVIMTIVVPLTRWSGLPGRADSTIFGGIAYFVAIGMGFMLVEIAMMQQLSLFLGHPIYSLVVVLAGLIFSTGAGSLASEKMRLRSVLSGRLPAAASAVAVASYALIALGVIHGQASQTLLPRVLISLALIVPCGFLMGFCFPVGLRWMRQLDRYDSLPWMWALNGAASVLASFIAILISMEATIAVSALVGAAWCALAAVALPWKIAAEASAAPATEPVAKVSLCT
ncbi:MAG: class I SAM-dependent methyltransferase [Candidatus Binataceae bacterium]